MASVIEYPTRFQGQDLQVKEALERASEQTGQSVNTLILSCVRAALPQVVASVQPSEGRLTNVDPLPDDVLDRLYSQRDDDPPGIEAIMAAQPLSPE